MSHNPSQKEGTKEIPDVLAKKVNHILADLFEIDVSDLKAEKHLFDDLGLDSLDAIDMVIKFQKEFGIRPSNEELQSIRTIADIHQLVDKYYESSTDEKNP